MKRNLWGMTIEDPNNVVLVNNTNSDIRAFETAILAELRATGTLPVELAELFKVTQIRNPNGSPRWILDPR